MFGISEQREHVLGTVGPAPGRKAWRGGRRGRPDWAEIKSLFCSQACYLRTGAMTSLRVSILCAAAVGYVFHSKCFAGSSRLHIPGLLVIFSLRALGLGLERSSNHTVLGWTPKRKWVGPWGMRTWVPLQGWNEKRLRPAQVNS